MAPTRCCRVCAEETTKLLSCSACHKVSYCSPGCQSADWSDQHKQECIRNQVDAAIGTAKEEMKAHNGNPLLNPSYHFKRSGEFSCVSEAQKVRGEIKEEERAQDHVWDAWETTKTKAKSKKLIEALQTFPWSTDAWGTLGWFYMAQFENDLPKDLRDKEKAKECFELAIHCARTLNPAWRADRTEELSWGLNYTRPYMRAMHGYMIVCRECGEIQLACKTAEQLLQLNPDDNQGVRLILPSWYLELGDTDAAEKILSAFDIEHDTFLAYTKVLLQYQLYQKGRINSSVMEKALKIALDCNQYVAYMLTRDEFTHDITYNYMSPGALCEADSYCEDGHAVWHSTSGAVDWLKSVQKRCGSKPPSEEVLVDVLKSTIVSMKCVFQDYSSNNHAQSQEGERGWVFATRKKSNMVGHAVPSFYWPEELDRIHTDGDPIVFFHRDMNNLHKSEWRKCLYTSIKEVPFWHILYNP
jgi:tetratricopeptide (TPR) repeat protein